MINDKQFNNLKALLKGQPIGSIEAFLKAGKYNINELATKLNCNADINSVAASFSIK